MSSVGKSKPLNKNSAVSERILHTDKAAAHSLKKSQQSMAGYNRTPGI